MRPENCAGNRAQCRHYQCTASSLTCVSVQTGLKVLREEVIPHGDNEVLLPVNLARLVAKAQTMFATQATQAVDVSLGPQQIISGVRDLLKSLVVVPGKDELSAEAQRNATVLLFNHIRSTLASKRVCSKHAARRL